jgi:hypothetical protein
VLTEAEKRLDRWRQATSRDAGPPAGDVLAQVRRHLADDLDAPKALAAIDAWTELPLEADTADDEAPDLVARIADALARGAALASGRAVVAAAEVALELAGDRLSARLGQVGGVLGVLELADVLGDLAVLLRELVDAVLPGPGVLRQLPEGTLASSSSSTRRSSASVAFGDGGCAT